MTRVCLLFQVSGAGDTPLEARNFAESVGVAKRDALTDIALLEFAIREDLNKKAQRAMAVMHPLKVVIINFPEDAVEDWMQLITLKISQWEQGKFLLQEKSILNKPILWKFLQRGTID